MGCSTTGTNVPISWMKHSGMRFLLMCFLFVLSDAGQLLDFPGSTFCLDKELQIKKPKDINQSKWQSIRFVDSSGLEMDSCHVFPDGSLLTVPESCINHEPGKRIVYISLTDSIENNTIYKISCDDEQADSGYYVPVVQCGSQNMLATLSRTVSGFADEVIVTPPPPSSWTIGIDNGTLVTVDVRTARRLGYTLTSNANYLTIGANFNAFGIKELYSQGQKFYIGEITLIQDKSNPKITIDVTLICAAGPPKCNATHMILSFPPIGSLQSIQIGSNNIPLTTSALQQQGITLYPNGIQLIIALNKLQAVVQSGQTSYSLSNLTLTFLINGQSVSMAINPSCSVQTNSSTPGSAICTKDGFMIIQVVSSDTIPSLDLTTVTVRDPTCTPQSRTPYIVSFKFPLTSCGTTKQFVAGQLLYENEVSALWKNLPRRSISRDSELRETVRCVYNGSSVAHITVAVNTLPPPVSKANNGSLELVINLYPDNTYQTPYSGNQYPVVKTLRDPIFLEVQVLNRNDPNIELVLDDCWATMSRDPMSLPQWNVIINGCPANQDNYLTVLHPVAANVPQAAYRKWFEVKTFAFMQGGELSTNLVYFQCSVVICNINAPDSPLCTNQCLTSRSRRDEVFLHRHSNLASLPGPVVLLDSEPSLSLEDEQDVIREVTIGVLPAFALVAVIGLVAVLTNLMRKSKL